MSDDLLTLTERGLYCEAGDFYVDPWRPVPRAVVTHAHADHARWGSDKYLVAAEGRHVFRRRLGKTAEIETREWGEQVDLDGVGVSFHPAGHILGSAQVRLEHRGRVWVVSGDYKTEPDPTCSPFEAVRCDVFITESTFGLPIYRWDPQTEIFDQINDWWRDNAQEGRASLLYAYALGKAQRLLAGVDRSIGPVYTHGATEKLVKDYRTSGIDLPETTYVGSMEKGTKYAGALICAPPSAHGTPWMRRFGPVSTGFASGWMRVRGRRRRRAVDRGFVLSDHVDWPSLLEAVEATGAECVWVTHGYREQVARWLRDRGIEAKVVATWFEGEGDADDDTGPDEPEETSETPATTPGGTAGETAS